MPGPTEAEIAAMTAAKTAEQKASEAKAAEAEAKAALEKAREASREADSLLRAERLKGTGKDSTTKGTCDLWPELYLPENELASKVVAGGCDGVLTELLEMAEAHPRHGADGSIEKRGTVIEAIKARLKRR